MRIPIKKVLLTTTLLMGLTGSAVMAAPQPPSAPTQAELAPQPERVDAPKGDVAQPPSAPPNADLNVKTNGNAKKVTEKIEVETPASVTGEKMQGTGTVVDFTTTGSKAFYTIVDNDHQTFYLIIDLDKTDNNVYFLSDINKETLEGANVGEVAPPPPPPVVDNDEDKKPQEKESSNVGFYFILIAMIGGIAVVYYLRKKKQDNADQDDYEDDFEDGNDDFENDFEDEIKEENKK